MRKWEEMELLSPLSLVHHLHSTTETHTHTHTHHSVKTNDSSLSGLWFAISTGLGLMHYGKIMFEILMKEKKSALVIFYFV